MTGDLPELEAPDGASFRATSDGFVLEATTRSKASLFFVPLILVWFALPFVANIQGFARVLIPIIGLVGLASAAMTIAGHIVVRRAGKQLEVLTGVGPVGKRLVTDWTQVTLLRQHVVERRGRRPREIAIALEGPQPIRFGQMLDDERRAYIMQILRRELGKR